jgi:hypothetical protein
MPGEAPAVVARHRGIGGELLLTDQAASATLKDQGLTAIAP